MRIDSSGLVSIGNTVASSMDGGANNLVVGTGSGTEGMTIYSGTANSGTIYFADGASGDDRFRGQIGYSHSDNAFSFRTNASASANMTLDSSGNLLVGKTSADDFASAGVQIEPAGQITASIGGNAGLKLNRGTNDGNIIELNKAGSPVGSIGVVSSNNLKIHSTQSGHSGLSFGTGIVYATDNSGDATNNGTDLGSSSYTWKDIYLGGGAYIGGTGSANHLDDYEEGTWSPSFQNDLTTTYTIRVGTYTKVGNLVTAWFHIDINVNGASSSQSLIIAGLPFAAINTTDNYGATGGLHCNQWSTSTKPDNALISPGANVAAVYKSNGQAGIQIPTHADIGNGNMLGFIIYRAT